MFGLPASPGPNAEVGSDHGLAVDPVHDAFDREARGRLTHGGRVPEHRRDRLAAAGGRAREGSPEVIGALLLDAEAASVGLHRRQMVIIAIVVIAVPTASFFM